MSVTVLGCATGIADAESVGANAKVVAANPINKSRFIKSSSARAMVDIDKRRMTVLFQE